ncbi:MAG: hypothetical protein ABI367_06965 [Mucilaginibacter sp.]
MTYISIADFFLIPFYLVIIYVIAFKFRDKYYTDGHRLRPYFIPGLTVKIIGAVAICIIYIFYFQSGDTLSYYDSAKTINDSFGESPLTWLRLITHTADPDNLNEGYLISKLYYYNNTSGYIVCVLGALIGKLCFTRLIGIAIIIASIAYTGIWALFICFIKMYPRLLKQSAIAVLFLPDTALWGSALFKDTICMFALGWLIFFFFRLIRTEKKISSTIFFIIAGLLILAVKPYILIALLPALLLRLITAIIGSKKTLFKKTLGLTMLILVGAFSLNTLKQNITGNLSKMILEDFTGIVTGFSNATFEISAEENGSGYSLGEIDGTVNGFVKKIVPAINVTFFRPYVWETDKLITKLSALESLTLFLFFLYVILKARLAIFRYIFTDQNLFTFLLFSLIFAYVVGLTTSNFGTLSRFKIPCMPFFLFSLFIINGYCDRKKIKKNIVKKEEKSSITN